MTSTINLPFTTGPYTGKKSSIITPNTGKIPDAINFKHPRGEKKMRNDFGIKHMKAGPKGDKKMAMAKGGKMKVPSSGAPKAAKSCRGIKSK